MLSSNMRLYGEPSGSLRNNTEKQATRLEQKTTEDKGVMSGNCENS